MQTISHIKEFFAPELNQVEQLMQQQLYSNVALAKDVGKYIVNSGGKRLRALLVLLAAKTCDYAGEQHIHMATVIEFIHTATLLHDDVIDHAEYRRKIPTTNNYWGNSTAILVGDFLYSRAFQLMMRCNNIEIFQIMADTTNSIAEGEILQLSHQHKHINEAQYRHAIELKTASLFAASCKIGAMLANSSTHTQQALFNYGYHLGMAYQLMDDLYDYQDNDTSRFLGKTPGNDFIEGKTTLPIIYLHRHATAKLQQDIEYYCNNRTPENFVNLRNLLLHSQAIDDVKNAAIAHINAANASWNSFNTTNNLGPELANFVVERQA